MDTLASIALSEVGEWRGAPMSTRSPFWLNSSIEPKETSTLSSNVSSSTFGELGILLPGRGVLRTAAWAERRAGGQDHDRHAEPSAPAEGRAQLDGAMTPTYNTAMRSKRTTRSAIRATRLASR